MSNDLKIPILILITGKLEQCAESAITTDVSQREDNSDNVGESNTLETDSRRYHG